MASVPIDLSSFKPVAGQGRQAAEIANAFTTIESYTGSALDPNALTQKGAVIGQTLVWDGSKWTPGDGRYPMAPTILGPVFPSPASSSAYTANRAILQPIPLYVPTAITRLSFYVNSGGGANNVDAGVYYSDDEATFTRLVSKGSTTTPANGAATLTIAATTLTPVAGRRWYLAFGCSSATPTFYTGGATTLPGFFQKDSSFPLPSSLTSVVAGGVGPYLVGQI